MRPSRVLVTAPVAATVTVLAVVLVAVLASAGCSRAQQDDAPSPSPSRTGVAAPALRDELLRMFREDQTERTGGGLPPGTKLPPPRDYDRTQRLKQIVARHGWPTRDLVGRDGAEAAWVVAQHADVDVAFQEQAVALMTPLVAAGQADPTDLAYLEDRVDVNRGRPQTYGSQARCRGGRPVAATPIVDVATVDARRVGVGMGPLAEYYAELALMCADEAADGMEAPQP